MNQTLTGNATIASAERILQHEPATGTPEERFDAAMAKSLAMAKEREAEPPTPQTKVRVKVTVLLDFNGPVDPASVGYCVASTLEWEYYANSNEPQAGNPSEIELVSAELVEA